MSDSHLPDDRAADASESDEVLRTDIEAEIDDHLSLATKELCAGGLNAVEAQRQAVARFGNVAKVARDCWWIQKGDELMFRRLAILAFVVVGLGLATLAWGGWKLGQTMAERTDRLSQQIADLNKTQQAILGRNQPPEITGYAYLDRKSVPASRVELSVYSAVKPEFVRRIWTDQQGDFRSGPLPAGEYFILSRLLSEFNNTSERLYNLQTQPVNLFPGAEIQPFELDLALTSELTLTLAKPWPDLIDVEIPEFPGRLRLQVILQFELGEVSHNIYPPVAAADPRLPTTGPVFGPAPKQISWQMKNPSQLPCVWTLPAGTYSMSMRLIGLWQGQEYLAAHSLGTSKSATNALMPPARTTQPSHVHDEILESLTDRTFDTYPSTSIVAEGRFRVNDHGRTELQVHFENDDLESATKAMAAEYIKAFPCNHDTDAGSWNLTPTMNPTAEVIQTDSNP